MTHPPLLNQQANKLLAACAVFLPEIAAVDGHQTVRSCQPFVRRECLSDDMAAGEHYPM